ncbi:hypothetical protein ACQU0X_26895 [Pseudovibrio ascidiaceicola]|uniref:hypothetical protein n=1 Tax=Pseudovibrio ascidiaceicola TaxID=285279 RepID=UPI003D369B16
MGKGEINRVAIPAIGGEITETVVFNKDFSFDEMHRSFEELADPKSGLDPKKLHYLLGNDDTQHRKVQPVQWEPANNILTSDVDLKR